MIALVVGILATVLFVILRFVVAIDDHKPLGIDEWWNELMVSIETPPGLILAWIPAIVGGTIDLGRLAMEFLTLGIDPYPRKPGVVFVAPEAPKDPEEHPFAALKALKTPAAAKDKKPKGK